MMLESYFDDSSDDKRARYCVSGGLIGREQDWDKFVVMWSPKARTLREPFRSTDCECGHGQFEDWTIEKRRALMSDIVSAVINSRVMGFASIVSADGYKKAFPNCKKDDAYMLTIPHTLMNMAFVADELGIDMNVWFESGKHDSKILKIFKDIKAMNWGPARRLRAISFDGKELYPLQAADLIAREAFKHVDNEGKKNTRIPVSRLVGSLSFHVWREKSLADLASKGGPNNLELLRYWDGNPGAPEFIGRRKISK